MNIKDYFKNEKQVLMLIDTYGELDQINISSDLFVDVVSSIVGQQLSVKAANTIWKRFENLFPKKKITPQSLLNISDEKIREAGCSFSKIKYMKGFAQMVINKDINLDTISKLSDEDFINELTKVKGIGKWTAEMILIFSLGRPDVFSIGDLGLRKAVSSLYGINRDDLEQIKNISEKWSPHRSDVSRYLWKSLDNEPK